MNGKNDIIGGILIGCFAMILIFTSFIYRPNGLRDQAYNKGVKDAKKGTIDYYVVQIRNGVADTTYKYSDN